MPKLPNVQRQKAAPPIYLGGSEVTAPAKGLVPVSPTTPALVSFSFNSPNSTTRETPLPPLFNREKTRGSKKLSDLSKVTERPRREPRSPIPGSHVQGSFCRTRVLSRFTWQRQSAQDSRYYRNTGISPETPIFLYFNTSEKRCLIIVDKKAVSLTGTTVSLLVAHKAMVWLLINLCFREKQ